MHLKVHALLGIAGGIANIAGLIPYIRDIFRRKTKPERAMWWIYFALFLLLFGAQASAGANWLLAVTGAYVLSAGVIAVLSLRYGYGHFHKRDIASLLIAAVGLAGWLLIDEPIVAIVVVITVDLAGFWLTLVKTWHAPYSETLVSWQLAWLAAILSVFAAGTDNLVMLLYPFYAVAGTLVIIWLIIYRRGKVKQDMPDF